MADLTYKDIHWIMTRYNHDNPQMQMSTSHIAKLISASPGLTKKWLKEMEAKNLVTCKDGLWSANKL